MCNVHKISQTFFRTVPENCAEDDKREISVQNRTLRVYISEVRAVRTFQTVFSDRTGFRQRVRSRKREDFWTLAFGARSLFRWRSKNKRGHGVDVVEGPSVGQSAARRRVAGARAYARTHVRKGHASARRRVAHTRMARRRANQYQAIPGVRRVCTPTVAPADRQSAST